jgi:curved DNA-binding protein CbpA
LKDYYKILQVTQLATEVEIKRAYRKLVAQYHPDVNPALDAHSILTEINEAYAILSDPVSKKTYDLIFSHPEILANMPLDVSFKNKPRKRRHGKKETIEEREKKKAYSLKRNRHFNKKMKYSSLLSLLLAGAIFFDHYLPTVQECQKVYVGQKPSHLAQKTELVSFFLAKGRKIEAYAVDDNYPKATISCAEATFHNSSLFGVLKNIQGCCTSPSTVCST